MVGAETITGDEQTQREIDLNYKERQKIHQVR